MTTGPNFAELPPEESMQVRAEAPQETAGELYSALGNVAIESSLELDELLQRRRGLLRKVIHTFPESPHGEELVTYDEMEAKWLQYSALWVDGDPYYIIGERRSRDRTELLLHKPRISMEPESLSSDRASLVLGTVPTRGYNAARKRTRAALTQKLTLAEDGLDYDEKYGTYRISAERPSSLFYHEEPPAHLEEAAEHVEQSIDRQHIMAGMRSPDIVMDFSQYGVANHVGELAVAFGKTEEIQNILQSYLAPKPTA